MEMFAIDEFRSFYVIWSISRVLETGLGHDSC